MGKKPTGSKQALFSEERSGRHGTLCRRHGSAHVPGGSVPSQPCPAHGLAYLAKLARFWVTLAMRVKVRAVRSSGYSWSRLNRDGDMMAGHRNRRNREALIRRSLMSGRPRLLHSCLHEAKTSLSSLGKTLK